MSIFSFMKIKSKHSKLVIHISLEILKWKNTVGWIINKKKVKNWERKEREEWQVIYKEKKAKILPKFVR